MVFIKIQLQFMNLYLVKNYHGTLYVSLRKLHEKSNYYFFWLIYYITLSRLDFTYYKEGLWKNGGLKNYNYFVTNFGTSLTVNTFPLKKECRSDL